MDLPASTSEELMVIATALSDSKHNTLFISHILFHIATSQRAGFWDAVTQNRKKGYPGWSTQQLKVRVISWNSQRPCKCSSFHKSSADHSLTIGLKNFVKLFVML